MADFRFITVVLMVLFNILQVNSVKVTCPSTFMTNYCEVPGLEDIKTMKRMPESTHFWRTCSLNRDYGVLIHRGQYYVWVDAGCGGTFELGGSDSVTPTSKWNAWGTWAACSASCGGGTQKRSRTCSTGDNTDCARATGESNVGTQACNKDACPTTPTPTVGGKDSICGRVPSDMGYKIVGGEEADQCEFPWMVLVYVRSRGVVCGGSIIDETHILTAAHCLVSGKLFTKQDDPKDLRIITGSSEMPFTRSQVEIPGLRIRTASKIKVHEEYDNSALTNDIGIITLSKPILFDRCHVPVCLAPKGTQSEGLTCKTMGWGKTSNSPRATVATDLKHSDVRIQSAHSCQRLFSRYNFVSASMLCVGGHGTGSCTGDSGGPLVCEKSGQYFVHGIVSAGVKGMCGTAPDEFTRVSYFRDWITANTK